MTLIRLVAVAILAGSVAAPAPAQFADGYGFDGINFVKAVRERDGDKAMQLFERDGTTLLNARDDKGQTALITAIGRRDDTWTVWLLQKGADPNLADRIGDTPLIAAARVGYEDAVEWLLTRKARVDSANRAGETALIIAVQQRQPQIVKVLLGQGADPDKSDNVAGLSAREYAKRDARSRDILAMIETSAKPKSDKLDDFKL